MRYAKIEEYEVSNGHLGGQSLYIQGCRFRCPNCFNPETWDFNGGKKWTPKIKKKFIELANRPYIKRISLLGGECLADENLDGILDLVHEIRLSCPNKTIWLYTGYIAQIEIERDEKDDFWNDEDDFYSYISFSPKSGSPYDFMRSVIANHVDVLVDGRYVESQRNPSLRWRGSSNQRVIDVQESLEQNKVVLYCD